MKPILYLAFILFSYIGYIFFIKNKKNTNRLRVNQEHGESLNSAGKKHPDLQSLTLNNSHLMQFKFGAQPDYSSWNKTLYCLIGISAVLPWIMNGMSISHKVTGSVFMIVFVSIILFVIFVTMDCKKVEIKDGKITVHGFLFRNYTLCSADIIEIKYRDRNQIFEIKERRTDNQNNEYKIKMLCFKRTDVEKVIEFCHLIENVNHCPVIEAYF